MKGERPEDKIRQNGDLNSGTQSNILIIPTRNGFEFVNKQQISFVSAERAYCTLHLRDGSSLLISRSLCQIQEELKDLPFYRVHHSYLVNLNCIKRVHQTEGALLQLECGREVPLARSRKEAFLEWVKAR
ncbi:MAG: LytTR family transcriptional regulator [Saprospiraceae bacterium]|jgi:two-component system LytT family response regulator|nr:LytTR family transcriptional regulator [Saprospiraceae bacterium]MBP9210892.1 LytTR family transcriptional regulator [Saprospiraceae bacterium]MBV6472155.1 hypothetical protein [Saprospiraceae bacterium]